jgi:hypothetical protein
MVKAERFKKRSASFYAPDDPSNPKPGVWYLRHVAFLGAQPPAVKGLKDIEFSEAADAVNFSETVTTQESDDMDKELQEKLAAAEKQLQAEKDARTKAEAERDSATAKADKAEKDVANFSEQAKQQRHAAHVSFAEAQVKAGTLLPKDKGAAVAVLDTLAAQSQPVEFSEGDTTKKVSPLEFVKGLIEGAKPKVQFGEHASGTVHDHGAAAGKSDAEIDKAAQDYMRKNKVSYAEALTAVTFTD